MKYTVPFLGALLAIFETFHAPACFDTHPHALLEGLTRARGQELQALCQRRRKVTDDGKCGPASQQGMASVAALDPALGALCAINLALLVTSSVAGWRAARGIGLAQPPAVLRHLSPAIGASVLCLSVASLDPGFDRGLISPAAALCLRAVSTQAQLMAAQLYVRSLLHSLHQRVAGASLPLAGARIERAAIIIWIASGISLIGGYGTAIATNRVRYVAWSYPCLTAGLVGFSVLIAMASRHVCKVVREHCKDSLVPPVHRLEFERSIRKLKIVSSMLVIFCVVGALQLAARFATQHNGDGALSANGRRPTENRLLLWLQSLIALFVALYLASVTRGLRSRLARRKARIAPEFTSNNVGDSATAPSAAVPRSPTRPRSPQQGPGTVPLSVVASEMGSRVASETFVMPS